MDLWDTKVLNKIDQCGRELSRWSKKCFGSVRRELEKKKMKATTTCKEGGNMN